MPEILGSTAIGGYDKGLNSNNNNRNIPSSADNTKIQNTPDPTRVTRGDARSERQDNNLQNGSNVRYDSNFQTFLQRLNQTPEMAEGLSSLFSGGELAAVLSGMSESTAEEMSMAMQLMNMDSDQLVAFLKEQAKAGNRFNGALFNLLRTAYMKANSEGVRNDILKFLKTYSDFSSTSHLEENILRNLSRMADAMPESWGSKLRDLTARFAEGVMDGDRRGNLQLIQKDIIPLMSQYISRTHDMGLPRTLLSLLTLDITRYENGSKENLLDSFHQLTGYGTLKSMLGQIDDGALLELLKNSRFDMSSDAIKLSDYINAAAARALRGEGSANVQQAFLKMVGAMLVNESVYMPINHYLVPLNMDGKMLFSELWVDPDSKEDYKGRNNPDERSIKLLFKMDAQPLGIFEMMLTATGENVDVRVSCPEGAAPFSKQMEQAVSGILKKNELNPSNVVVRKSIKPAKLTEAFPKIIEWRNGVDVKI